jgi:hypothetical protein
MTGGGALDSSVTLDEVFTVLGTRRVPLAPELAGYLVLEIAEHADPNGGAVDPKAVFVSEEGTVALVKPRRDARDGAGDHAEASIRAMLVRLLEASGSQTAALAAAGKRKTPAGLPSLAEELETALIPVNRAAGRRALARLAREVRRVTLGVGRNALPSTSDAMPSSRRSYASYPSQPASVPTGADGAPVSARPSAHTFSREEDPTTARGQIPSELLRKATPGTSNEMPTLQFEPSSREPSPSQADVDSLISDFGVSGSAEHEHARDLKALAGLEPTPPPGSPSRRPRAPAAIESVAPRGTSSDGGVESLLAMTPTDDAPSRSANSMGVETRNERARPVVAPTPDPMIPTREVRRPRGDAQLPTQPSQLKRSGGSLVSAPQMSSGRGAGLWGVIALAAVAGGGYAVWQLRPSDRDSKPAQGLASVAPSAGAPRIVPTCKATLVVTDVPPRAEVLLHQGQAPVDVEKMPVGARLEFVATAEGFAPKRVVVPAGATWDTGADGKPRFEAAVQLDKSPAKSGANDPWPPAEPGTEVGGQGTPGTVHVVATPRGAEIWMLAGMGPEARVEQLRCDRDVDVLVAGPGPYRKRLRAAASDFAIDGSGASGPATLSGAAAAAPAKAATRMARISAK